MLAMNCKRGFRDAHQDNQPATMTARINGTKLSQGTNSAPAGAAGRRIRLAAQSIAVSARGMSFQTDTPFAPFTELKIRISVPALSPGGEATDIACDGVVVECRGSHQWKVYYVTVAFVNLPRSKQKHLALASRLGLWARPAVTLDAAPPCDSFFGGTRGHVSC